MYVSSAVGNVFCEMFCLALTRMSESESEKDQYRGKSFQILIC